MFPVVSLAITLINVCSPMSPEQMGYMASQMKFRTDMKPIKIERPIGDTSSQNLLDERPSDGLSNSISSSVSSFFKECLGCLRDPTRADTPVSQIVSNPMQSMKKKNNYRMQQMTVGMIPTGLRYRGRSPDRSDSEQQDGGATQAVELLERMGCIGNVLSGGNVGGSTERITAIETSSPRPIDPVVEPTQLDHQLKAPVDPEHTEHFYDIADKASDEMFENTSSISPITSMTASTNLIDNLTDIIQKSPSTGTSPQSVIEQNNSNVKEQAQSGSGEITGFVCTLSEVTDDNAIEDFLDVAVMHSRSDDVSSRLNGGEFVLDLDDSSTDSNSDTTGTSIPPASHVDKLDMYELVDASQDYTGTGDGDFVLL